MGMSNAVICSGVLVYVVILNMQFLEARTSCGSKFQDVGSKALLADLVLQGRITQMSKPKENQRYNATFALRKILKGNLRKNIGKKIEIGEFASDGSGCLMDVEPKGNYLVFLKQTVAGRNGFYHISANPTEYSRRDQRTIQKTLSCDDCVSAPKVHLRKSFVLTEGKKLNLKCDISGSPEPIVTWYKDGKDIQRHSHFKIKKSKNFYKLKSDKITQYHAGVYTCRAENMLGNASTDAIVKVRKISLDGTTRGTDKSAEPQGPQNITLQTTTHEQGNISSTSAPKHYVNCHKRWDGYCRNKGQCLYIEALGEKFCRCQHNFTGARCEYWDLHAFMKELRKRQMIDFDRKVTMAGIIIGGFLLIVLFVAAYCMARKRRKEFFHRQQLRDQRRSHQALQNGATYTKVSTLDGPVPLVDHSPRIHLGSQFSKESREYGTQTDEYDPFMALRETVIDGPGEDPCLDEDPMIDRPSINLPPPYMETTRPRLSAVSATPIIDPDYIVYPLNTTTVNAVVETQAHNPPVNASQHSSPSQSSKTESAHEQCPTIDDHLPNPTGGSDSASRDIDSLDVEAHSDYDNNMSDLEDEGQGAAFSSDEIKPLHHNHHGNNEIHDASSGTSDSDSSDGLDHEHFKELQQKRLINMKHKGTRVPAPNNEPILWQGYGNSVPSQPLDPYFNNYAGYTNDRIMPIQGKKTSVPIDTHRLINSPQRQNSPQV